MSLHRYMRPVLSAALLAIAAGFVPAVVSLPAQAATVAIEVAPAGPMPPPIVEERIVSPGPNYHWVPGHWVWRDYQWVWARGHWHAGAVAVMPRVIVETPPPPPAPSYVWIAGHWHWEGGGWRWSAGHWVRRG